MPLYRAMQVLKGNLPSAVEEAQAILDSFSPQVQAQLICAIYLGREHVHSSELRSDVDLSRGYTDHVSNDEYARILYEKGENVVMYLDKLEACSKASNFDLNTL